MWYSEFNSVFFLTTGTILAGAVGMIVRYCLKSKCEDVSVCWGMIRVERDVSLETQVELRGLELGIKDEGEEKAMQ